MSKYKFIYSVIAITLSFFILALCGCEDGAVSSLSAESTSFETVISSEIVISSETIYF